MDAWRPTPAYAGPSPDRALRRDIRRVTSILGETLARTEGDDLLALVEQVRAHAKEGRLDQLPEFDLATITRLVRAFTAYFHLANITEQVHRGRALSRVTRGARAAGSSGRSPGSPRPASRRTRSAEILRQVALRPVFTAHPTEVARRSTIDKLRRVAALLEEPDSPRRTRRLEEAVELLWLTDEIRVERPEPTDEARNVVYYLEGLSGGGAPRRARGAARPARRHRGRPAARRAAAALRELGGRRPRRQPPRHARDDREVLTLQAVHGIRLLRTLVDRVRRDLSVSNRVGAVSDDRPQALALLERVIAAKGGLEKLQGIKTIIARQTLTNRDSEGKAQSETTNYIQYPDHFRIETPAMTQAFDGAQAWMKDSRGVRDGGEAMARDARASMRRDLIALLLAAHDGKLTPRLLPDVKDADGRLTRTLDMTAPDLNPIVLHVDPATALVTKQTFIADAPGRPLVEEQFSDYRPVDGIQIPFQAVRKVGALSVERRDIDVKINAPVDPVLFKRPAS